MNRPALKIVAVREEPKPTYTQVGPEVRKRADELAARVSRVQVSLSGNFTTTVKKEEAERLLGEAELLCRSTRNALRGGL